MSYDQVAAKDAIVGLYPMVTAGTERVLATIADEADDAVAPHLDIRSLKVAVVDGLFLKVTFETRGPVLPEGDPGMAGLAYRVYFDTHKPLATRGERPPRRLEHTGLPGGTWRSQQRVPICCIRIGVNASVKTEGTRSHCRGLCRTRLDRARSLRRCNGRRSPAAIADQVVPHAVTLRGSRVPVDLCPR
jgi:hypothetical protein